jgi:hypothetical protein
MQVTKEKISMKKTEKYPFPKSQFMFLKPVQLVTCILLLVIWWGGGVMYAQSNQRLQEFDRYFEVDNIGNLHVFTTANTYDIKDDYYFKGELLPKKFEDLFADNWRESLPEELRTYAVSKVRNGDEDAYILRFEGIGTQNMIGLFEIENELLRFKRRLAYQYCYDYVCFQLDSWIQDFDGDARLDIFQKVVVVDSYLTDQLIDEYEQQLRQNGEGDFVPTSGFSINKDEYSHIYFEQ